MPTLFTKETAVDAARKSVIARKANQIAAIERARQAAEDRLVLLEKLALANGGADENIRRGVIFAQLDQCDNFINKAKTAEDFTKLTAAKERLWHLVHPKTGSFKPKPTKTAPVQAQPEPEA